MNKLLQLKGPFKGRKHPKAVVIPSLRKGQAVTDEEIKRLAEQLKEGLSFWESEMYISGALISAHYKRVIPKSRRIAYIFSGEGKSVNDSICGAKFEPFTETNSQNVAKRHVFTYHISLEKLEDAINKLLLCEQIVKTQFGGIITSEDISEINQGNIAIEGATKSLFTNVIVDCSSVLYFNVEYNKEDIHPNSLITLYKTEESVISVLRRIGIDINGERLLDECTVYLRQDQIDILKDRAPYLIAMVNDFSEYNIPIPQQHEPEESQLIPMPSNEPVIGVIDTRFDQSCYFAEWVEYTDMIDPEISVEPEDFFHGTAVTSLIVDGPFINPELDDGCGRFKVRHFAVAKPRGASSFTILKAIQSIVNQNRDIKVWNLSLGSALEVSENHISPEASFLDEIQSEYDVIFVIAGTNDNDRTKQKRVGAPADSINALVVNAVDCNDCEATYSRSGPVLGFFFKPDVSFFGGDSNGYMRVCGPLGEAYVNGTSFAAPWVTRKLAFLIYQMGLSREIAKALIIDAAAGWNPQDNVSAYKGYGVVPTHIKDIIQTKNDEIRFVISNAIDEYETYTYSLPVPIVNGMQPFWSRATMTYFPECNRNQGVDYTSTEMDLHFGRVFRDSKGRVLLKEINDNKQSSETGGGIYEESARQLYRKWDNVKRISETVKNVIRPKKVYEAGMWGIRIVTKERGGEKLGVGTPFGIVVTLKEMNGKNRIEDFIRLCGLYGWLVTPLDIDLSLDLYSHINEEIEWE